MERDRGSSTSEEPPPETRNTIKTSSPHDRTSSTILSPAIRLLASGNGCPPTITSHRTFVLERRSVTRIPRLTRSPRRVSTAAPIFRLALPIPINTTAVKSSSGICSPIRLRVLPSTHNFCFITESGSMACRVPRNTRFAASLRSIIADIERCEPRY